MLETFFKIRFGVQPNLFVYFQFIFGIPCLGLQILRSDWKWFNNLQGCCSRENDIVFLDRVLKILESWVPRCHKVVAMWTATRWIWVDGWQISMIWQAAHLYHWFIRWETQPETRISEPNPSSKCMKMKNSLHLINLLSETFRKYCVSIIDLRTKKYDTTLNYLVSCKLSSDIFLSQLLAKPVFKMFYPVRDLSELRVKMKVKERIPWKIWSGVWEKL